MRTIKLVVGDFHIGTGPFLKDGSPNPLEDFHQDKKFIEFLEFYSTNKYSKFNVELILNGDFFNFLQIEYDGKTHTVITESLSVYQIKKIISGWPDIFSALKKFNSSDNKSITFITGNHDPQLLWDGVRNTLREEIGGKVNFYNLFYEFDGFHIAHGQQMEVQNKFNPHKLFLFKSTPEPILNIPWTSRFCIDVLTTIKKSNPASDKIKPFKSFLKWAFFNDPRFFFYASLKSIFYVIKSVLLPSKYFRIPFIDLYRNITSIKFFPPLDSGARQILKNDHIHTVILSHTHLYKHVQYAKDKEYLNTGTWTDITSLNLSDLGTKVFLSYIVIKYPGGGSRPRAKLKRWRGSWKIMEDVF